MRCMPDLVQNEIAVRVEHGFAMATNLARCDTAGLTVALVPFDDTRNRDTKTFSHNTRRLS